MYDQRAYTRGSHFDGQAKVSADGETWVDANISNISSGGLKFYSQAEYAEGDILWFDILLRGFLSEFEVKTKGEVRHHSVQDGVHHYGIAFKGLSPDKKIQIDENVKGDRPVARGVYEADE